MENNAYKDRDRQEIKTDNDNVENLSNAALNRIIVEDKLQPPITVKSIISYGVDHSDMHKIYNWPLLTAKNTKLIMLQFKINHNIIYIKDKIKKVNLISNDLCHLREREKHTIKHMMLKCSYVTIFWNEDLAWWTQITTKIYIYQARPFYMDLLSQANTITKQSNKRNTFY